MFMKQMMDREAQYFATNARKKLRALDSQQEPVLVSWGSFAVLDRLIHPSHFWTCAIIERVHSSTSATQQYPGNKEFRSNVRFVFLHGDT